MNHNGPSPLTGIYPWRHSHSHFFLLILLQPDYSHERWLCKHWKCVHAADWWSERFCWRRHTCIGLTFHPRLIYFSGANLNDIVPPLPSLQRQDWASFPTWSSHVHTYASLDIYLCADIHRTFIEAMYCHLTLTITITTNPQPLTLTPTLTQTQF